MELLCFDEKNRAYLRAHRKSIHALNVFPVKSHQLKFWFYWNNRILPTKLSLQNSFQNVSNCCRDITSSSEEDQTEDAFLKVRRAQPEKWKLWVLFYYPPNKIVKLQQIFHQNSRVLIRRCRGSTKQPEKWILGSHMWIIVLLLPTRNLKPFKTYLLNAFRLDKKRTFKKTTGHCSYVVRPFILFLME